MLQLIRSKASSWVFKILFIVLVLSFGVWGIGDILRTKTEEVTVAHVGGQAITAEAFQREYQQQQKQLAASMGNQFSPELAKQLGLPGQVLDRMVSQALFSDLANRMGLRAPDDVLTSILATVPMFKNEQGQFDRNRFLAYVQQSGMTEEGYIENLRHNLIINQIYGAVAAGANPPKQSGRCDLRLPQREAHRRYGPRRRCQHPGPAGTRRRDAGEISEGSRGSLTRRPNTASSRSSGCGPRRWPPASRVSDGEITEYFNAHKDEFAHSRKARIPDLRGAGRGGRQGRRR